VVVGAILGIYAFFRTSVVRSCPSDACFQAQFDRAYAHKVDDLQCSAMQMITLFVEEIRKAADTTVEAGVAAAVQTLCDKGLASLLSVSFSKHNLTETYGAEVGDVAMEYFVSAELVGENVFFCPDASDAPDDAALVNCQNLAVLAFNALVLLRLAATNAEAKATVVGLLGFALMGVEGSDKIIAAVLDAAPLLEKYWTAVKKTILMVINGGCTHFEEIVAYFTTLTNDVCGERPPPQPGQGGEPVGPVWTGLKWGGAVAVGLVLMVASIVVGTGRDGRFSVGTYFSVFMTGLALAIPFFLLQISYKDLTALTLFSGVLMGGLPPAPSAYIVGSCMAMVAPAAWAAYAFLNRHKFAWPCAGTGRMALCVVGSILVTLLLIGLVLYLTTSVEMRLNDGRGKDVKQCSFFGCKALPWSAVTPGKYGYCGSVVAGIAVNIKVDVSASDPFEVTLRQLVVGGKDYLDVKKCTDICPDPVVVHLSKTAVNGKYSFTRDECVSCIMDNAPTKVKSIEMSLTSPTSIRLFLSVGLTVQIDLEHPPPPPC
jgi:hypothetical protein